jgi:tryptophanyl-tRNA synthetase
MSPKRKLRSLTGIKPTGTLHLGNYLGAILPALELAKNSDAFYFIADYHALTTVHDPKELRNLTYEVAATWLACGLDTDKVVFFRQSDISEVFELTWILECFAAKGLLNRAHAYKALVQANQESGKDDDFGVSGGLFNYPVLMAADILLYETDFVPVGQDQRQHVEIARDIALALNNVYGADLLHLPEAKIDKDVQTVVGLDGRKMSKSYDNVIPLFAEPKAMEKLIMSIKTDSKGVDEPKDPETDNIFQLYKHFATPTQVAELKEAYEKGGMGYGDAKKRLVIAIENQLADKRELYKKLIGNQADLDDLLLEGAKRAQSVALPVLQRLRSAIGISAS